MSQQAARVITSATRQTRIEGNPLLAMQRLVGNRGTISYLQSVKENRSAVHPTLRVTTPIAVQRDNPGEKKSGAINEKRIIGRVLIYDKLTDEMISGWDFETTEAFLNEKMSEGKPIRTGSYDATVRESGGNVFLKWRTHEVHLDNDWFSNKGKFVKDASGLVRLTLQLKVSGGTLLKEGYEAGKLPPGAEDSGGGKKGQKPGGGGSGGAAGGSGTKPTGEAEGGGGGTKAAESKTSEAEPGGGKKEGGTGTGTHTGTGTKPGSKYGWLGWLELDQGTIDVLEDIFEALSDSGEFIALQQVLHTLEELAKHADQLPALLSPDELVELVLGIESADTRDIVEELRTWVVQDTAADPPSKDAGRKGIMAVAAKLLGLVRKLRKALKPVFAARGTFQVVYGVLQAALADVDSFSLLLAHLQGKRLPPDALATLTRRIGHEAASRLILELQQAKADVQITVQQFSSADLIHRNNIAGAIVSVAMMAVPKPLRWVLNKTDLDRVVADNLVDELIPPRLVTLINDALLKITAPLVDASKNLVKQLDTVFTNAEKVAAEKIPEAIKAVLPAPTLQRAKNTPTILGGHLAALSGTAVKGLVAAMPKKGDQSLSNAAAEVDAWLSRNEKRPVISANDPKLPTRYYRYFPASASSKPRIIVRTPTGIVADVPQLMIHPRNPNKQGLLWRKGSIVKEGRDVLNQVVITAELGPPSGRQGFEQLLPLGTEVLDQKGWERAHAQGQGRGVESAEGIRLAPRDVNQVLQRVYVEGRLAEIVREKTPGVRVFLTTETTTWPRTLRLQKIQYTLTLARPPDKIGTEIFFVSLSVSNDKYQPKVHSPGVEWRAGWNQIDRYLDPKSSSSGALPKGKKRATRKK